MVKRYLSLALVAVFVLTAMLSGCGGVGTSAEQPAETQAAATGGEATAPETEEQASEPVTLSWMLAGNGQEPDTDKICAEAAKYMKEKLNLNYTIELNVFSYGDPYNQKANTMLASGEPFDICFTAGWAADYRANSISGYFKQLDDYLASKPAITQIVGQDFLNGVKVDGKTYAVPCNKEKVHNYGYLVKKDLADKYNLDPKAITKTEDMEPFFEQVKNGEQGITPLLIVEMESPIRFLDWDTLSDDGAPGALYPDNRDTKVINQFLAPEQIEFYKKLREYNQKGYIAKDAASMTNINDQLKSGKYFACSQSLKPGKAEEMKGSTGGIDWVQVDITKPVMTNRETTGAMLAIPAASKNPDAAFQFIELLYTDKFLVNLFVNGIEGEHYEKVSENVIKLLGGEKSGYKAGNGWRFGDQFKNYLMDNEDPDKWAKWEEYNKAGVPMNSLGFVWNKDKVDTELAACKAVVQTYYRQLYTGSVDVEPTVKKFEADFQKAGVDKVLADMQSQYDEWYAKNGKK